MLSRLSMHEINLFFFAIFNTASPFSFLWYFSLSVAYEFGEQIINGFLRNLYVSSGFTHVVSIS